MLISVVFLQIFCKYSTKRGGLGPLGPSPKSAKLLFKTVDLQDDFCRLCVGSQTEKDVSPYA